MQRSPPSIRSTVSTTAAAFATRGLPYASVRTAGLADALKRIAADAGCELRLCKPDAIAAELSGTDLVVVADPAARGAVPDAPPAEATTGANLFRALEFGQAARKPELWFPRDTRRHRARRCMAARRRLRP